MWEVKADIEKNRLYIKLGDEVKSERVAEEVHAIAGEARKLKYGFTCLTRIDTERTISQEEFTYIRLVQEFLSLIGVSKVVRVGPAHMLEVFEACGRSAGGYCADLAETVEEAERMLDEPVC